MPALPDIHIIARQIERIVRQSGGLATLPELAAELLNALNEPACDRSRVARLIQTDPALSARILSMAAAEKGAQTGSSIEQAVAYLSVDRLRYAILSAKVFETLNGSDSAQRMLPRRQLALHSLAAARAAQALAELLLPEPQRPTVYLAALLHDIGKAALDETMPKSYDRLVEMAKQSGREIYLIEQQQIGLDHSALGKRLAEKWQLGQTICNCIWLHHTDPQTLRATLSEPIPAAVVALADRLARKAHLGQSGSFSEPEDIDDWAQMLGVSAPQIEQILRDLPITVSELCQEFASESARQNGRYLRAVQHTAVKLAQKNQELETTSSQARQLNRQNALIEDLLADMTEHHSAAEIAESFCRFWRAYLDCGLTAIVIFPESDIPVGQTLEMAIAARNGQSRICLIQTPSDQPAAPLLAQFGIYEFDAGYQWLLEPIADQVNPDALRVAPLAVGQRLVGLLVFEARGGQDLLPENCQTVCRMAAFALRMALSIQKYSNLSEQFLKTVSALRTARTELAKTKSLQSLAEMAAGAAHEINTPLAVISGRAQLLADSETDEQRRQTLQQIVQRCAEISDIISQLMTFAKPPAPTKRSVPAQQAIQMAIEKAAKICPDIAKYLSVSGDATLSIYVDAEQIAVALSELLVNALQAYPDQAGTVEVLCDNDEPGQMVQICVRDQGCGMEQQVLQKAADPFFSSRPAGRRRGMGLTFAQRLAEWNGGRLDIISQPSKGTAVSLKLPVG